LCKYLLEEGASLHIYDPKVTEKQIKWELNHITDAEMQKSLTVSVAESAYDACSEAHALVVCTEWDEFQTLDYTKIYSDMVKPAFVFDGRLILDHSKLQKIGFKVACVGKRLDISETTLDAQPAQPVIPI